MMTGMRNPFEGLFVPRAVKQAAGVLVAALKHTPRPGGVDISRQDDPVMVQAVMLVLKHYPQYAVVKAKKHLTLVRRQDIESTMSPELSAQLAKDGRIGSTGEDLIDDE